MNSFPEKNLIYQVGQGGFTAIITILTHHKFKVSLLLFTLNSMDFITSFLADFKIRENEI